MIMGLVYHPEKLVLGKYNIIAVNGDQAAILWKDDQYFVINARGLCIKPTPMDGMQALLLADRAGFVHPDPIPLDEVSKWREYARKVHIPMRSIRKRSFASP